MNMNTELFYLINNGLSNPYFDFMMLPLSDVGGLTFYAIVLAILLVMSWKDVLSLGRYRGLVRLCCPSLILTVVITAGAKLLFSQPRPFLVLEHVHVLTSSVDPNSFPSGHTATTLSVMSVLFLKARDYFTHSNLIRCLCIIYCILIPFSRVYIGMHYPLDVFIGGIIGAASGLIAVRYLEV